MLTKQIAKHPFLFVGCWELRQMLGRSARDEQQLMETIEEIPLDSIYYHMHSFLLRHRYIAGPYPNDFATWAAIQVRDRVLGERLGILYPYDFGDLESLRAKIINIIEQHLSELQIIPRVLYGEPFHFMQSRIIEIPTGLEARTLAEFREILATVDVSVIYYHTYEAILRLGRSKGDFAVWMEEQLGMPDLANQIAKLDPYLTSLETIRHRILKICDAYWEKGEKNEST
jgi:hypothetical protein